MIPDAKPVQVENIIEDFVELPQRMPYSLLAVSCSDRRTRAIKIKKYSIA